MLIGIDDTDSPRRMCTTYVGAVLARELSAASFRIGRMLLVRLNPNVTHKTRGNAAIAIEAEGDPGEAFRIACACVERLADMDAENTHPGVAVVEKRPSPAFYEKAVKDFCELEEAVGVLEDAGALYRGYKLGRGLIGATAAISGDFRDRTYEILAYRKEENWGMPRNIDRASFFSADAATSPHTWDTVDRTNELVVCVPHTPDPVLFGIRGESPFWVAYARTFILSEETSMEQIYCTNQGTDAHLMEGRIGALQEGRSYLLRGVVDSLPQTGPGGHVWFDLRDGASVVRCRAYEPTKGFRHVVRSLRPGDRLLAAGSYKRGSINLEKMKVIALAADVRLRPPVCSRCGKRMTSAGTGKGYKCRTCQMKSREPELTGYPRDLVPCWKEVPPCARRHLAMPLIRMQSDGGCKPVEGSGH